MHAPVRRAMPPACQDTLAAAAAVQRWVAAGFHRLATPQACSAVLEAAAAVLQSAMVAAVHHSATELPLVEAGQQALLLLG